VSTKDQSCERQLRELIEYASRANYLIVATFIECASGMKATRKERKKVLALAQKREIDVVLVSETTRWGRSMTDLVNTVQDLEARGVSLVSLSGMSFDFSTAQGKLVSSILASLAEFERDLISERVKSGLANARAKGKVLGRPKRSGKIHDNRVRSRVLLLRQQGETIRDIAKTCKLSTHTVQTIVNSAKRVNSQSPSLASFT
jgi:DNA invertase Pin-like site-specific DNA recombinase